MNGDRYPEYPHYPDEPDDPPRRSRWRNCLFAGISILLIVSLLASSLAAWFAFRQARLDERARQEQQAATLATVAAEVAATAAEATRVAPTAEAHIAIATPAQVVPAAQSGETINRIVIINDDGQVETLTPNGEDRRVLTNDSGLFYQFPTWSPDGERLAVIGANLTGGGIYVLPDSATAIDVPDAGQRVYFSVNRTPFYLYWSPDGQTLAFLANDPRAVMGLNVIAGDGLGGSRQLATGSPFYWDWTEDSHQMLIHVGQGSAEGLSLIDLEGETRAKDLATPGLFQAPGIAAGGRYWAFAEKQAGLSSLVVVDTQSGTRQSYQQSGSMALSWSPVRDQLAYTGGDVDGHPFWGPLYVLDIPGGQARLLSRQTVLAFFWSPDGRHIAFITFGAEPDDGINVLAAKSRLARPAPVQGQGFLSLSVVDVNTGRGARLLDFEPTLSWLGQFLPFFDQYALSHRIWSPDSSALVLPLREGGESAIYVVPVDTGRPYRLGEGEIAFWSQR